MYVHMYINIWVLLMVNNAGASLTSANIELPVYPTHKVQCAHLCAYVQVQESCTAHTNGQSFCVILGRLPPSGAMATNCGLQRMYSLPGKVQCDSVVCGQ